MGEALVGNEAVDQLSKFDGALKNFSAASGPGQGRGIDGMLVTKWDTVDDKVCYPRNSFSPVHLMLHVEQVGAALSMTYVTGQPILFVGCGQVLKLLFPVFLTVTDSLLHACRPIRI